MSIAVKTNPERQQQAYQLIVELQHERQETWSLYCHVTELMPSSVNWTVRSNPAKTQPPKKLK